MKTSRGIEIELRCIQTLLDKFYASHTPPEVPTYSQKALGGITVKYPLTQALVDKEGECTDEEKKEWQAYLVKDQIYQARLTKDLLELILLQGVVVEYPSSDDWVKKQQRAHIQVPDDPDARYLHWLQTEVVSGDEDMHHIYMEVMKLSHVEEALLAIVEQAFQRAMGNRERGNDLRDRKESTVRQVVDNRTVDRGRHGVRSRKVSKRMG